ncbi:hypothetical protein CGK74_16930 [Thauera propionica]|uniref:Uncharacterized protein n=2 Tax=Thauera propionica TaxID=2019431 RepID=A0A235EUH3_9RHOO|nr:hypothetical protein CGK74_16930 [Thauera propionica]
MNRRGEIVRGMTPQGGRRDLDDLEAALKIKAEWKLYEDDEVTHNPAPHRQILEAWHRGSPKMVTRLEAHGRC